MNLSDVVTVSVDSDGLPLRHVLTCLGDRGQIRKGKSNYPLEWKDSGLKDVINEFIEQMNDPATGFFDDSQGTTGPPAPEGKTWGLYTN